MQIGTKFTVSVHILLLVEAFKNQYKITSDFIARSVNTNPVVIRKLMSLLRSASLIRVTQGTGGIELTRSSNDISLADIYRAVEPQPNLFRMHRDSAAACLVGGNIEALLEPHLERVQDDFFESLGRIKLAELLDSLDLINLEK